MNAKSKLMVYYADGVIEMNTTFATFVAILRYCLFSIYVLPSLWQYI